MNRIVFGVGLGWMLGGIFRGDSGEGAAGAIVVFLIIVGAWLNFTTKEGEEQP